MLACRRAILYCCTYHQPPLQERVRHEADTIDNVRRCERNRLWLREKVVEVSIESEFAKSHWLVDFEWDDHSGNQKVIACASILVSACACTSTRRKRTLKHISTIIFKQLDGKLPLRIVSSFNVVVEIHALEIVVLPSYLSDFVVE